MNNLLRILGLILLLLSTSACANTLVISSKFKINYENPELISHSTNTLTLKYKPWYLFHQIVDPKNMYPGIDLTGLEHAFIKKIFSDQPDASLPSWINTLADAQRKELAFSSQIKPQKFEKNNALLLGSYSDLHQTGYLYLLEKQTIHQITVVGNEKHFNSVINWIKER